MREKLTLGDVPGDVNVARLCSERSRIAVGADRHDDAHAKVAYGFDDGRHHDRGAPIRHDGTLAR